jgi:uncharacterized protein YbjT (DUF2867 family)
MILVIGGTGLIGSEVLRLLSQSGVAACALTRNPQKAKAMSGITWLPEIWPNRTRCQRLSAAR